MTKNEILKYRRSLSELATKLDCSLADDQREVMHMELRDFPTGPLLATEAVLDSGTQEVETGLIANEANLLREVNAALGRIDAGSFGRCETCSKVIAKTRLEAIPYARQCIRCAKLAEDRTVLAKAPQAP